MSGAAVKLSYSGYGMAGRQGSKIPVIGLGGIMNGKDAVNLYAAGASSPFKSVLQTLLIRQSLPQPVQGSYKINHITDISQLKK